MRLSALGKTSWKELKTTTSCGPADRMLGYSEEKATIPCMGALGVMRLTADRETTVC
ncbi:hypothetical protein D3C83_324850 [compost metagenome]